MSSIPPLYSFFFLSGGCHAGARVSFSEGPLLLRFLPLHLAGHGLQGKSLDDQGAARTPDTGTGSGTAATQEEVFWGP